VDRPLQVEQAGNWCRWLQPAHRSSDALPDGDDRAEPDQRQSAPDGRLDPHRLLRLFLQRGPTGCAFASTSSASAASTPSSCASSTRRFPTLAQLKLPEIFNEVAKEKTGLVLVTGATGSGKSTTLAACSTKSTTKSVHIITLEDPVEFVHPHKKATFNQREMGSDFSTFCHRPARRVAPGPQSGAGRRNARPRNGGNRPQRRRNRPPGAEHAAHH
jgi:hypothetical protein